MGPEDWFTWLRRAASYLCSPASAHFLTADVGGTRLGLGPQCPCGRLTDAKDSRQRWARNTSFLLQTQSSSLGKKAPWDHHVTCRALLVGCQVCLKTWQRSNQPDGKTRDPRRKLPFPAGECARMVPIWVTGEEACRLSD